MGSFGKARRIFRWIVKATVLSCSAIVVVYVSYLAGGRMNPTTIVADRIVEVPSSDDAPVLKRIAKCESDARQKSAKNGQITYHVNSDGTVDIGIMEINSVHFAEATRLGLDLTREEDNMKFAKWLYANYGTEPWYSSRSCWNK